MEKSKESQIEQERSSNSNLVQERSSGDFSGRQRENTGQHPEQKQVCSEINKSLIAPKQFIQPPFSISSDEASIPQSQRRPRFKIAGPKMTINSDIDRRPSKSYHEKLLEKQKYKSFLEDDINLQLQNSFFHDPYKGRKMLKKDQNKHSYHEEQISKKKEQPEEIVPPVAPQSIFQKQSAASKLKIQQLRQDKKECRCGCHSNEKESSKKLEQGPKIRVVLESYWDEGFSVVIQKNKPSQNNP